MDKDEKIHNYVRDAYSQIASSKKSSCCSSNTSCCGIENPEKQATDLGYTEAELSSLPEGTNMGLSCGNPTAIASLKPGETVLDLGSGGGLDVFIAAEKVGPSGKSIGVDMTYEVLMKARNNTKEFKKNLLE